jgi:hypothetical protein
LISQTEQLIKKSFLYHYGRGFRGVEEWWIHVIQQDEQRRLDALFGLALLDESIHRLLTSKCEELFNTFEFSEELREKLRKWEGGSLNELAQYLQEDGF